jgi:hypothetical protein
LTARRSSCGHSPASVPANRAFADADLNSAYAASPSAFLKKAFSRALTGGAGVGKPQAGLVTALLAAIILMVAKSFS